MFHCREQSLTSLLDEMWSFTRLQQRMLDWDAAQVRLASTPPSLQSLARDDVLRQLLSLHRDSQKSQGRVPLIVYSILMDESILWVGSPLSL